jgi:hypothetical protein
MSDARRVMEQAAQYIADHPHRFKFFNNGIPVVGLGSTGCALGWAGYFQQNIFKRVRGWFSLKHQLDDVAVSLGYKNEGEFYFEMNRVCERHVHRRHWTKDARACAATMRELAQERA